MEEVRNTVEHKAGDMKGVFLSEMLNHDWVGPDEMLGILKDLNICPDKIVSEPNLRNGMIAAGMEYYAALGFDKTYSMECVNDLMNQLNGSLEDRIKRTERAAAEQQEKNGHELSKTAAKSR